MSDIFYEVLRDYSINIYHSEGTNDCSSHFHQQLELLYVKKGEVVVKINDQVDTLTQGQLAIVDSFDNHQYTHKDGAISCCLSIPVHYLKRYASVMSNKKIKDKYIKDLDLAENIYQKILNVISALHENELILEGNIFILLGTIINNNIVQEDDKTSHDLVKNILIFIEDNYKNSITLDIIAKNFGYSKYYFSHLFNKCFKCNLNDYLNLVRCRHSINCVLEEHMSVSDAAFASGFVSMRTFYRTFKKYFNMTPKEYFHKNKN